MEFNIASECRKYRDEIVFFKANGKRVFSDYTFETKIFYEKVSLKLKKFKYSNLNEFKDDVHEFIQHIGHEKLGTAKSSSIDKFLKNIFPDESNVDNNSNIINNINEYDNYTERDSDCMSGFCQVAINAMKKCKTESIHALNTDQQTKSKSSKSFDSSSSSSSSVSNIISTVFDYGLDLGEKLASKYNIILDEKGNDDNIININTSTNHNKNTPPKKTQNSSDNNVELTTRCVRNHYGKDAYLYNYKIPPPQRTIKSKPSPKVTIIENSNDKNIKTNQISSKTRTNNTNISVAVDNEIIVKPNKVSKVSSTTISTTNTSTSRNSSIKKPNSMENINLESNSIHNSNKKLIGVKQINNNNNIQYVAEAIICGRTITLGSYSTAIMAAR
jgi:hypothetical protein